MHHILLSQQLTSVPTTMDLSKKYSDFSENVKFVIEKQKFLMKNQTPKEIKRLEVEIQDNMLSKSPKLRLKVLVKVQN